jgi:hypothetical protein
MKKITIVLLALLVPAAGFSQIVFTVKAGGSMNCAQVGYSMGSLEPFFGLDVVALSGKITSNSTTWSADVAGDLFRSGTYDSETSGNITLFMPRLGAKFFFKAGALRPYVTASVLKSFASLDTKNHVTYKSYNSDGDVTYESENDTTLLPDETKSLVEDLLGFFAFEGGIGVEYTINKYISVGAEYGFGLMLPSGETKSTEAEDYNADGHDDYRYESTTKLSATLGITHALLVVNFHL